MLGELQEKRLKTEIKYMKQKKVINFLNKILRSSVVLSQVALSMQINQLDWDAKL